MSAGTVAIMAAGVAGLGVVRKLMADIAWRWKSDALDAEQRRGQSADLHALEVVRQKHELRRGLRTIDSSAVTDEHPAISPAGVPDAEPRSTTGRSTRVG